MWGEGAGLPSWAWKGIRMRPKSSQALRGGSSDLGWQRDSEAHLLQSTFATNEELREGRRHASGDWMDLGTEPAPLHPSRQHTQTKRGSCPQINPHAPNAYCDGELSRRSLVLKTSIMFRTGRCTTHTFIPHFCSRRPQMGSAKPS